MKTVYQDENNVVLVENSVEWKPCINRESKSLELTIKLYSCHDIKMKLLLVVTPPSIYQCCCGGSKIFPSYACWCEQITNYAHFALLCQGWWSCNNSCQCWISSSIWVKYLTAAFRTSRRPGRCFDLVRRTLKYCMRKLSIEVTWQRNLCSNTDRYVGGIGRGHLVALYGRLTE